jgi:regulator of sirC expression with transglutaminase-like and TPR domain
VASPLEFFRSLADLEDGEIDLGRAALEIGRLERPDLDVERYLRLLDNFAVRVARVSTPLATLDRLNHILFDVERFRGNIADYYDPANSHLNAVLDRKLGIPITLSVVYMEVGRRVGLDIEGVGLPGHFIVRLNDAPGKLLLDPFGRGRRLTVEDCQGLLSAIYGPAARLESYMLEAVGKKQILARILNNLRAVRRHQQQWKRVLPLLDMHLALFPDDTERIDERVSLLTQLEDYRSALAQFESCRRPQVRAQVASSMQQAAKTCRRVN